MLPIFIISLLYIDHIHAIITSNALYTGVGPSPVVLSPEMIRHAEHLEISYRNYMNEPLLPGSSSSLTKLQLAESLYNLPNQIVLSHGIQSNDPILNYGNKIALDLFKTTWNEFTTMPSRLTAEPTNQAIRAEFMQNVKTNGYVTNYSGIRIACDQKTRFKIENAIVWNIVIDNELIGQAATFKKPMEYLK